MVPLHLCCILFTRISLCESETRSVYTNYLAIFSSQILKNYNNYRGKRRDYEDRDRYFAELRGAIVIILNTFVLKPKGTIPAN